MFPDNNDRAIELLEMIARNTGSIDADTDELGGPDGIPEGPQYINPNNYLIAETADLDDANDDGTITLEPGDTTPIVDVDRDRPVAVLAVGANDVNDVRYQLYRDNSVVVGGTTNSPLGTLNSPFSFPNELGVSVPVEGRVQYRAHYPRDATGTVELAGRMHVELL